MPFLSSLQRQHEAYTAKRHWRQRLRALLGGMVRR